MTLLEFCVGDRFVTEDDRVHRVKDRVTDLRGDLFFLCDNFFDGGLELLPAATPVKARVTLLEPAPKDPYCH